MGIDLSVLIGLLPVLGLGAGAYFMRNKLRLPDWLSKILPTKVGPNKTQEIILEDTNPTIIQQQKIIEKQEQVSSEVKDKITKILKTAKTNTGTIQTTTTTISELDNILKECW